MIRDFWSYLDLLPCSTRILHLCDSAYLWDIPSEYASLSLITMRKMTKIYQLALGQKLLVSIAWRLSHAFFSLGMSRVHVHSRTCWTGNSSLSSLAFVTLKNNLMVLSLRAMISQFVFLMLIAVFCFAGFLYALWT